MAEVSLNEATREVERLAVEASNRRLDVGFARAQLRDRVHRVKRKIHQPHILLGSFFAGFSFGLLSKTRVGRDVARLPGGLVSVAVLGSRLYSAFHRGKGVTEGRVTPSLTPL